MFLISSHQARPLLWNSNISAFVPLLYAKSIGISDQSPTLSWSLGSHGLLPKQLLLAKSVQLLLEACDLNVIENQKPVAQENISKTLYDLAFNGLQKVNEPEVFAAMCKCVCDYHQTVREWANLESQFFPVQRWSVDEQLNQKCKQNNSGEQSTLSSQNFSKQRKRLTFDNYAHFERCLDFSQPKHLPVLLSQWERHVQAKYGAVVAHACRAMALLSGHKKPEETQAAYKFGQSFAFAFVATNELCSFLNDEGEEERNRLRLPMLLFLLQEANQTDTQWIQQLREEHLCSLQTHRVS